MTDRRANDDRGAGLVAGLVILFAFTFLGLVWLARDVDRAVSNRTAAQSIAFQAARSGAQQAEVAALRQGDVTAIDAAAARAASARTATSLFAAYGVDGRLVALDLTGDTVTATVTINDGGRTVTGIATARTERAP